MRTAEVRVFLPQTCLGENGEHRAVSFFLYNFQKAVDLSKDDLLGDILQDLTTEVSESPGVVKYAGDIG